MKSNNFDIARLGLSLAVVLTHAIGILPANYGLMADVLQVVGGQRPVDGFFIISGFLIFRSFRRSPELLPYIERRARRIYPGLFTVVVACTILGAAMTVLPSSQYWPGAMKYLAANLAFATFLHQNLPGVFTNLPETWVNGPLWTLKVEVMFYAAVPLIVVVSRRIPFPPMAAAIYVGSVIYYMALMHYAASRPHFEQLARQLPGQMSFFIAGGLIDYAFPTFRRFCLPLCVVALLSLLTRFYPLYPAALAILMIGFCAVLPMTVRLPGDLSYGLYIWHFPILQTVASLGLLSDRPGLRLASVLTICFAMAWLSWTFVEKRWLVRRVQHARTAATGPDVPARA